MPFRPVHIVAALIAAVAFILAFIASGVMIVSAAFMALGLGAVGWLAWSLVRQMGAGTHGRST